MPIKTDNSLREILRKLKPSDVVYPGTFVVFLGIIIILFFFATGFISKNINKIFYSEGSGATQALDIAQYTLVAKKMNIAVEAPKDGGTTAVNTTLDEPRKIQTAPATLTLDRKAISIIVKNSTSKKGVATELAKSFASAGFNMPQTGNEAKLYATTTIIVKENQKNYEPLLLEVIRKIYPEVIATTTLTSTADAIVIIGAH